MSVADRNTGLRAIETDYRGIKFRSRAEARWAVMFDLVGCKWLYEHEGYDLPSGRYLPDFWLPDLSLFAEVKGVAAQFTPYDMDRIRDLARISGHPVLLCADLFESANSLIPAVSSDPRNPEGYIDLVWSMRKGRPWFEYDNPAEPCLLANGHNERMTWQMAAEEAVGYFGNAGRYVP